MLSYDVILRDPMFSRFHRTPTCDEQKDRRTDGRTDTGPQHSVARWKRFKSVFFDRDYWWFFFGVSGRCVKCRHERISTKLRHIFTYDCCLKKLVRTPPGMYPTGWGQKSLFRTDFELWPYVSLQRNVISTIGKKLVNLQGLPYMPPNFVNFGPETAENGWRVFAHPLNFRIGRHCQPYCMDVI